MANNTLFEATSTLLESRVFVAFFLTLLAGLSTGLGGLIVYFTRSTHARFLSFAMGLSAGVMIFVSFVELWRQSQETFSQWMLHRAHSPEHGMLYTLLFFLLGMVVMGVIDYLVPEEKNPHEIKALDPSPTTDAPLSKASTVETSDQHSLKRVGLLTTLAIGIHNFPEGIATFVSAIEDPSLGIAIAAAIAIHNIPEGVAIAIPILHATGSRKKALFYTFLSGLAEPLGALLAWAVLMPFMSPIVLAALLAAVAGIMVYISIDELLPAAQAYGYHHASIYGLGIGMAIMGVSLVLLS